MQAHFVNREAVQGKLPRHQDSSIFSIHSMEVEVQEIELARNRCVNMSNWNDYDSGGNAHSAHVDHLCYSSI